MLRILMLSAVVPALCGCLDSGGGPAQSQSAAEEEMQDPPLETPVEKLESALVCTSFDNPDKQPVLLIHGTGTYGAEQYSWNYLPWLREQGFDVCHVTYPDRGLGDQQIAAEYIVHAVRRMQAMSGSKVDMVGHSQGGSMPRWAIRWWPSVQSAVDDFVQHAAPNYGTDIASEQFFDMPPAFWQFDPDSEFVRAMNSGDDTPGAIDFTSIYTVYDELVQPQLPQSTSALEPDQDNPRVSNIQLQAVCPNNLADHVQIGLTDYATALLTVDALLNDGPADVERAGGIALCLLPSFIDANQATGLFEAGSDFFNRLPEGFQTVSEEPPLKPYARGYADAE